MRLDGTGNGASRVAGPGGRAWARLCVDRAVAREQQVAFRLWHGVARVAGLDASAGERAGLVAKEARHRAQVLVDLGAPCERPRVIEQAKRQGFEGLAR